MHFTSTAGVVYVDPDYKINPRPFPMTRCLDNCGE